MEIMLLLTVLIVCISICYYLMSKMPYFERLKVRYLPPVPILGNMVPVVFGRLSFAETICEAYNRFPDEKYIGFHDFRTPVYIIRDPELINSIAVKNFDYFSDHNNFVNAELNPITSKNLFGLKGDHWREMRKILTPSFTSSKMKMMFELIRECAENFCDFLANESTYGRVYNMKDMLCRYANDALTTCAYGIKLDSNKDPDNEFLFIGRNNLNLEGNTLMKFIMNKHFPLLSKLLGIRLFGEKVENFFKRVVTNSVKLRKEKDIVRPDMIQLMLESMDNNDKLINIDEMAAQAFIFFMGGFETTSNILGFLVHEVGVNPDVQSKLQAEIDNIVEQTNGKPTYEDINGMQYLDAVLKETLRLYPLVVFIDRKCVKNFELPPATPNGKPIMLKPGDTIWFPNYSLHLDPKYFSDPHKFNPDRFLEGNINQSVYMPFGLGPRKCIGYRFAIMQSKMLLFQLLSRCNLEPSKVKTRIPLVLSKRTFIMLPEGGFWMKLQTRKSTVST